MIGRWVLAAGSVFAAVPAAAHTGHGDTTGLVSGLLHPLTGPDHLAAMVAVGLWAGFAGGLRAWAWPAAFVAAMLVGAVIGWQAVAVGRGRGRDRGKRARLGPLSSRRAGARRSRLGLALIAAFGLAHGYAHGAEAPADGSGFAYTAGFLAATAVLHAAGLALATALRRPLLVRGLGAGVALFGFALVAAAGGLA
ncbi:MAG: HupE/UreJ family protein [Acetobacteraceae bacterium]|nr:HupE/UreJ family protein [Acetobacteraceae bacterium]